jgi:ribosome biogenesis GTPase
MSDRTGTVIASHGKEYEVRTDSGETVRCVLRGRLRLEDKTAVNPVAVGDIVIFSHTSDDKGAIREVESRRSRLSRRAPEPYSHLEQVIVANLDRLVVVVATTRPKYKTRTIDRYLVSGEAGGLDSVVCFNKIDLIEDRTPVEQDASDYAKASYPVLVTSATTGEGVSDLAVVLSGHTSVFAGPSGAGKSSLLNAIDPDLSLRVGDISETTTKGRHTTSSVRLLPIPGGGYIADTPGMRELGLFDVTRRMLDDCFPEFREPALLCRFADCAHVSEPGCGVKEAVEDGSVSPKRYESYIRIRNSLPE